MIVALVVALVVMTGAVWLMIRRAHASKRPPTTKVGGRFGGVEIRLRGGACDAARALEGRRFLAKDAPALPLPACSAKQCKCGFTKLSDRRTDGRRAVHGGPTAVLFLAINRRNKRDRRRAAQAPRRS